MSELAVRVRRRALARRALGLVRGEVGMGDLVGEAWAPARALTHRVRRPDAADGPGVGVVLSPHLDDAVLGAWSALRSEGLMVVVNVFAGVPPPGTLGWWDRFTGAADSADRMRTRRVEDVTALAHANRPSHNLDFLPIEFRRRAPRAVAIAGETLSAVPNIARVLVPAAIGMHPDHVLVRMAGHVLWQAGIEVTLYAEMPYTRNWGWPAWVGSGPEERYLDVDLAWLPAMSTSPWTPEALHPCPRVLSASEAAAKLAAIRCYATQYPALTAGRLEQLSHRSLIGHEVYWTVASRE